MPRTEWTSLQLIRRRKRSANQIELAKRMGTSHPAISIFEAGKVKNPTADFLQRYVKGLQSFGIRTSMKEVKKALAETLAEAEARATSKAA
jgi:predicted transcriptional regulator